MDMVFQNSFITYTSKNNNQTYDSVSEYSAAESSSFKDLHIILQKCYIKFNMETKYDHIYRLTFFGGCSTLTRMQLSSELCSPSSNVDKLSLFSSTSVNTNDIVKLPRLSLYLKVGDIQSFTGVDLR